MRTEQQEADSTDRTAGRTADGADGPRGVRGIPIRAWRAVGRRRTGRPMFLAALALAGVTLLAAGGLGGWWASVALSGSTGMATARDEALRAGEQAVQNFNTLDYRSPQAVVNLWLASSTGTLHDQINAGQADFRTEIQQGNTVTTATVLDGALTELNDSQCKASLIVAAEITLKPATGSATTKQVRIQGSLAGTRANGSCTGWKLSNIERVPVGSSTSTSPVPTTSTKSTAPTSEPTTSTTSSGH